MKKKNSWEAFEGDTVDDDIGRRRSLQRKATSLYHQSTKGENCPFKSTEIKRNTYFLVKNETQTTARLWRRSWLLFS